MLILYNLYTCRHSSKFDTRVACEFNSDLQYLIFLAIMHLPDKPDCIWSYTWVLTWLQLGLTSVCYFMSSTQDWNAWTLQTNAALRRPCNQNLDKSTTHFYQERLTTAPRLEFVQVLHSFWAEMHNASILQ